MKYSSVKTENSWQSKNYFFLKCYVRLKVKKHKLQLPPFLFFFLIGMYGKVNFLFFSYKHVWKSKFPFFSYRHVWKSKFPFFSYKHVWKSKLIIINDNIFNSRTKMHSIYDSVN